MNKTYPPKPIKFKPLIWDEERVNTLIKMISEGYTGAEVGNVLGCTRNSVLGMVHRLRKKAARQGTPILGLGTANDGQRRHGPSDSPRQIKIAIPKITNPALASKATLALPTTSFLKSKSSECRFMYATRNEDGTWDMCGRPTEGNLPFCPGHAELIYVPVKPKSETVSPDFVMKKKAFRTLPSFITPVLPEDIS